MIAPSSATTSGTQIVYWHETGTESASTNNGTYGTGFWIDPELLAEIERLKAACSNPLPIVIDDEDQEPESVDHPVTPLEEESLPAAPRSPYPIRDIFFTKGKTMSEKYSLGHAQVVHATDKALRVRLEDYDDEEQWVPKSQVHDDSEVYDDKEHDEGELIVSKWWAERQTWT